MIDKYEYLEHTADTKIRAYGKTLEEAFTNSLMATTGVMTNIKKIKKEHSKNIDVSSKSLKSLLYDFLDEVLFLLDVEGFLAGSVESIKIEKKDKYYLTCSIMGDFAENYEVHSTIKAITYSEMEIKKEKENHIIELVLDL